MPRKAIRILGIAGSLRRGSYNRALLRAAVDLAPPEMEPDIFELDRLPLYNADLDVGEGPPPVATLRRAIGQADALLVATPEYNFSVPGVLKNAIDWASRPPGSSVLLGKPVALMGAARGRFGTVRAQLALRQVFLYTQSPVMMRPFLHVANAGGVFDAEGRLVDAATGEALRELLAALVSFAGQQP